MIILINEGRAKLTANGFFSAFCTVAGGGGREGRGRLRKITRDMRERCRTQISFIPGLMAGFQ